MNLRRGNTYNLMVHLADEQGVAIDINSIDKVEFIFGEVRKVFTSDQVATGYNAETCCFLVKLEQEDTFKLNGAAVECQARVLYKSGMVRASDIETTDILTVLSRQILELEEAEGGDE